MTRIAIVTGGTRGIGASISKGLKAAGHVVVATYHGNDAAAAAFKDETGCDVRKFDVGSFAACQDACAGIAKELGPVDILVNNAGITRDGVLHRMAEAQWHEVMETNLTSCFNMSRAVIPGMRDRNFGRVINISSINGQKGQFGQTNYAAAKAGMIGFTKALALESAAKGITVNCICPGYIATEMTGAMKEDVLKSIVAQIPTGRMGAPEEVAGAVVFLASDVAAYFNGAVFAMNGGQYMAS